MDTISTYIRIPTTLAPASTSASELGNLAAEALSSDDACCIVFPISQTSNPVKKIFSIASVRLTTNAFLRKISDNKEITSTRIAIFPTLCDPVVVFEAGSSAEKYIHSYVLPGHERNLKGLIKLLTESLTGINPSLAGIGLILRRR